MNWQSRPATAHRSSGANEPTLLTHLEQQGPESWTIKMSSPPCFLGVDVGTERCKAILFNEKGESLARAQASYSVEVPRPSWAEQNPEIWWSAIRKTVSTVLRTRRASRGDATCVGVTGQSPVIVPVDKHGKPLMNALIWMDRRAVKETLELAEATGVADDPSMSLPKALWIKKHRPSEFLRAHKFLQATDFIEFKLTGRFVTDWFDASTFHYDTHRHVWPEKLFNDLGIPVDKLPSVSRPAEVIGRVTDRAALETGLKRGTPVAACGIDAYTALIGVNALTPGTVCEITGSSTVILAPSGHKITDREGRVHCEKFPLLPDFWIAWGTMSTTGAAMKWFRDNFGRPRQSYRILDQEAEKAPPGSGGLIFLPYLMGERSPIWDMNARGAFLGFSLNSPRSHFARAVLEGCAFGVRHNLETMEKLGISINDIRSCGGAASSRVFSQIKADIIGKSITIPREIEASALGAAVAAAVSVKTYPDIRTAAGEMVHTRSRIHPQKTLKQKYDHCFRMYKEAYLNLKAYFERYHSPAPA
jgi:xylulokinase